MKRPIEAIVLGLSACGYPLTQLAVRRWGMRGAAVAECVCAGLAIRDASMVASGVPARLRAVPAALLRLEFAAAGVALLTGARPLLSARPTERAAPPGAADTIWRAAVAALFALHTIRFGIYLSPDQGRRATPGRGRCRTGNRRTLRSVTGRQVRCSDSRSGWRSCRHPRHAL